MSTIRRKVFGGEVFTKKVVMQLGYIYYEKGENNENK